jgi:hypothetical protein
MASDLVGKERANSSLEDPLCRKTQQIVVGGWIHMKTSASNSIFENRWATWKRSIRATLDKGRGTKSLRTNLKQIKPWIGPF